MCDFLHYCFVCARRTSCVFMCVHSPPRMLRCHHLPMNPFTLKFTVKSFQWLVIAPHLQLLCNYLLLIKFVFIPFLKNRFKGLCCLCSLICSWFGCWKMNKVICASEEGDTGVEFMYRQLVKKNPPLPLQGLCQKIFPYRLSPPVAL